MTLFDKLKVRAGETAQQLSMRSVLPEDTSPIPSTHIGGS